MTKSRAERAEALEKWADRVATGDLEVAEQRTGDILSAATELDMIVDRG